MHIINGVNADGRGEKITGVPTEQQVSANMALINRTASDVNKNRKPAHVAFLEMARLAGRLNAQFMICNQTHADLAYYRSVHEALTIALRQYRPATPDILAVNVAKVVAWMREIVPDFGAGTDQYLKLKGEIKCQMGAIMTPEILTQKLGR